MSAGKYDGATVEVANWEKFNPRGDVKRPSWFRMENDTALGAEFFGLDSDQKWLWVVILSLTSQRNGEPVVWNSGYIQANTGISAAKQEVTLAFFEQTGRLNISRNVDVTCAYTTPNVDQNISSATERDGTERDGTGRDGTNERDETKRNSVFDSESNKSGMGIQVKAEAPTVAETKTGEGIPAEVKTEWEQTLRSVNRAPNWIRDEAPIVRLYQRTKSWDRVKHALAGFRFEKAGNGYDPRLHVHLGRLRDEESFAYLENLGEQGLAPPRRRVVVDADTARMELECEEALRSLRR